MKTKRFQRGYVIDPYTLFPSGGGGGGTGTARIQAKAPSDAASTSMLGWHCYKRLSGNSNWTLAGTQSGTGDLDYTYTGLAVGTWEFKANTYNANGDAPDFALLSKVIS